MLDRAFDYQSNRHCAKTLPVIGVTDGVFDYQSNRHCAKTPLMPSQALVSLITSQIDTAPKHHHEECQARQV